MAWPKRGTRKLVIDGVTWLWHYDAHCEFCSSECVTIGRTGCPHYLFVDTFSRHFIRNPGNMAAAIRWATDNHWTPETGPDQALTATEDAFEWLPADRKHKSNCPESIPY